MDRLRQDFKIIEIPVEMESGMDEAISLWDALYGCRDSSLSLIAGIENKAERRVERTLASLVKNVQGEDPKRWARRIQRRISEGDESVTFLQKQAAKGALR